MGIYRNFVILKKYQIYGSFRLVFKGPQKIVNAILYAPSPNSNIMDITNSSLSGHVDIYSHVKPSNNSKSNPNNPTNVSSAKLNTTNPISSILISKELS
jgi:hypothetical protein